nr:hypothetical protein [Pseudoxanthomonas sp.]
MSLPRVLSSRPAGWLPGLLLVVVATGACSRQPEPAPTATAAKDVAAPAPAAPAVDALAEVTASMERFLAARSFHAVMTVEGSQPMQNEMDFVAPDRYRMIMPVGTQVIIGDTMYMEMHGQQTKVPIPEGTVSQWRDPMKIRENRSGMSAEFLGEENVDGQRARRYRVRHTQPEPGEFLYWIDRDGRPLQLRHSGETASGPYTMTLAYSRFDDPAITIESP